MGKLVLAKTVDEKTVMWPVKARMPKDNGRFEVLEFKAKFKLLAKSAIDAMRDLPDADLLREVVVGWDEQVVDDTGQPVPFSDEARAIMLEPVWLRVALNDAFNEANRGGK